MLNSLQNGRYRIIAAIGGGGFGRIYIAEDTRRPGNPRCVVKHLQPASRESSFLELARRLFNTEAEILEKLGRHEQIPQLLAYFEENEEFYLVQEFIDGISLSDEQASHAKFDEAQVIVLLQDILSILAFVHSHQVIHRDIKPSNIIRRASDGKLVLIDFGAVKQIRQLPNNSGQSEMSVAIGTQGYMPNEQSAGKPRLNSDIYAVGIVAIQAITGLRPSKLSEDPNTGEIVWRHEAKVSNKLADIIDKMVRYDYRTRYQSTFEVLQALQELINPSLASKRYTWKQFIRSGLSIIGISWLITTLLVLGVRELKLLQPLELAAYDRMMQLRFTTEFYKNLSFEGKVNQDVDDKLLVVTVDDKNILSGDDIINQLLIKLQSYQPSVIGLNIYTPEQKITASLGRQDNQDNIIGVCKLGSAGVLEIPPILPIKNVGFNDVLVDDNNIVRRSLLFANPDTNKKCTAKNSFAALLATKFLQQQGLHTDFTLKGDWKIGQVSIKFLDSNSGGYRRTPARGYEIMLDYHSVGNIAQEVSLDDVLANRINPKLVENRIVLVGTNVSNSNLGYYTPYSQRRRISDVQLQAQAVSQILNAATNNRALLRIWSEPEQITWIAFWALAGGILSYPLRRFWVLFPSKVLILLVLLITTFYIFTQSGWVPLIAPALALIITGWLAAALRVYVNKYQLKIRSHSIPDTIAKSRASNSKSVRDSQLITIPPISILQGLGNITVQGKLKANQITRYTITCQQGQHLTLDVVEGDVDIKVIEPDGATIVTEINTTINQATQWQGLLPRSGNYILEVTTIKKSQYLVNVNLAA
ncbi:serine/threonine kinase [Calothrix sp. NIES-4071]|nr:serine/threonine kinase [Calothrix sp. NIES-4071]BAZ60157.1 serine/threonine kinase [Calothrix sp. NIES-4105]